MFLATEEGFQKATRYGQYARDYSDPSLGEVAGAMIGEVYDMPGSAASLAREAAIARDESPQIAREDWADHPNYREGVEWYEGMREETARILADRRDRMDSRQRIMANSSTVESILGFGSALIAGVPEPANAASAMVAASMTYGAGGLVKVLGRGAQTLRHLSTFSKATKTGEQVLQGAVLEGAIGSTIMEPLAWQISESQGEEYTAQDAALGFGGSVLFPIATYGVGRLFGTVARARGVNERDVGLEIGAEQFLNGEEINPDAAVSLEAIDVKREQEMAREVLDAEAQGLSREFDELQNEAAFYHQAVEDTQRSIEYARYGLGGYDNQPELYSALKSLEASRAAREAKAPNLLASVRSFGGIKDEAVKADLLVSGVTQQRLPGIFNNNTGLSVDEVGLRLTEAGYFRERPTVDEVTQLLAEAARGRDILPAYADIAGYQNAPEDVGALQFLEEEGIDPDAALAQAKQPNETVKALEAELAEYRAKASKLQDPLANTRERRRKLDGQIAALPPVNTLAARAGEYMKNAPAIDEAFVNDPNYLGKPEVAAAWGKPDDAVMQKEIDDFLAVADERDKNIVARVDEEVNMEAKLTTAWAECRRGV